MSDMDSDCDDVFAEDSKGMNVADAEVPIEEKKKRRGIIEKRRRTRINNSLSELRRLVPAAFEKQGSAKLEKAEILQMTVDHLKMLHSSGVDIFSFDAPKFMTDYFSLGFRECAFEVARYLVSYEGMNFQDPLRLRLMSHLQCFSAQRELSLRHTAQCLWNPLRSSSPPEGSPSPWFQRTFRSRSPVRGAAGPPFLGDAGRGDGDDSEMPPRSSSPPVRLYRPWGAEMAC